MIEVILFFSIAAAIIAIEGKNLLSSIISLGGVGFSLAVIMLFIGAPDVAIVQVLVEVLLLIILIRATIDRDLTDIRSKREFLVMIFGVSTVGALFLVMIFGMSSLPEFGTSFNELARLVNTEMPASQYLLNGLKETGVPNIVTAVLLDYRAYDTLGEATVLFTAIIGAITILRKESR